MGAGVWMEAWRGCCLKCEGIKGFAESNCRRQQRIAGCPALLMLPACLPSCLQRTGIPPLERSYAERYGGQPDYEAYKAATNLLVPWWPRSKWP